MRYLSRKFKPLQTASIFDLKTELFAFIAILALYTLVKSILLEVLYVFCTIQKKFQHS